MRLLSLKGHTYYTMNIKQKRKNGKGSKKRRDSDLLSGLGQIWEGTERCPLQLTIEANKIIGQTLPTHIFAIHEYQLTSGSADQLKSIFKLFNDQLSSDILIRLTSCSYLPISKLPNQIIGLKRFSKTCFCTKNNDDDDDDCRICKQ